ncbi:MAG TPA: PAS domain S-box protein [Planctomycetaceae bacterium]|jgi:PAS domain S-box-containing protein|nr:PAS domain S-box protein [Planctomycetaceae bacterium]
MPKPIRTPLHVLLLEDRDSDARLVVAELRSAGFEPTYKRVDTQQDYLSALDPALDVILADFALPQFDALRALKLLRERALDIPFIIVSGSIGEDLAVRALQEGADDYLLKDRLGRLGPAIRQALQSKRLRQEQRQIEEQLRIQSQALAAAANGILISETNGNIVWANPAFTAISGYALGEVRGRNPRFLKSGKHDSTFYRDLWQTILSGQVWKSELVNRRKDGSLYFVEQTVTPVLDARGEISHFIAIEQDISERKRAETALRERVSLAALISDVGVALSRGDTLRDVLQQCAESLVRNLDAAFARIWTLNESENVLELQASAGMYTHLDGPHGRVPVGQLKIGLIAQERQAHLTNDVYNDPRVGDRDWARRERMVAFAGYPLLLDDRLVGVMALFARQQLSEATLEAMEAVANQIAVGISRKQTEEFLRETNETLESLVRAAPLAIITLDREARVLQWNPAAERIFGWSSAEVVGKSLPTIPDEQRQEFETILEGDWRGEPRSDLKLRRLRKDGSLVDVSLWTAPLRDRKGQIVAILRLFADVTERMRLEEQFRQAQKMEAVGRLAGGVAHDFNNILTVIGGFCDVVLEATSPQDPVVSDLVEIKKAADRAASLTRQLLAFSRRQVLSPKILDLNSLIRDMQKMVARILGEDVDLRLALAEPLGQIEADPGQIEQVLLNLVVNARDAMLSGGQLLIEAKNATLDATYTDVHFDAKEGAYVLLVVSDNGVGMDAQTKSHLFEPFFTTKTEGKGTGLGLATIYGIVKQSRGFISVYSEPGRGTAFKIYFPRVDKSAASGKTETINPVTLAGTETVLLAEDEDTLRALAQRVLTKSGYRVLSVPNGAEAIRLLDSHDGPFHLLVTDVVMPKAGGRQVAEHAALRFPELKVLYISGYTDDAVVLNGVFEADVAFLQKPFSPEALLRKVREVLDRERGAALSP